MANYENKVTTLQHKTKYNGVDNLIVYDRCTEGHWMQRKATVTIVEFGYQIIDIVNWNANLITTVEPQVDPTSEMCAYGTQIHRARCAQ